MKQPMYLKKHYISVFDTESDTTTGAMTSWQYAPVIENPEELEYTDALLTRCNNTAEGMQSFHDFITDNFNEGDKLIIYVHNLGWDIAFILNYVMKDLHYTFSEEKLTDNTFNLLITNMGQVFYISYLYNNIEIKFQDSLKIIPFGLGEAGDKYNTKYQKIRDENGKEIDYSELLSDEYCLHDVLCLSELITIQINQGIDPVHTMSLASHCLKTFKDKFYNSSPLATNYKKERELDSKTKPNKQQVYRHFFPQLDHTAKFARTTEEYGVISQDAYCRAAYRGGLTYCNPDTAGIIFISKWYYDLNKDADFMKEIIASGNYRIVNNISHIDVHSMYPSKALKGWREYNTLPLGKPVLHSGAPDQRTLDGFANHTEHFLVRFTCKFSIKDRLHQFPSIQIKYFMFPGNEWLESSVIAGVPLQVKLTLTDVEFFDFINRYDVYDINFIDYAVFKAYKCEDIFGCYMGFYYPQKAAAKDFVHKQSVKSFLNDLTGKFGTNVMAAIKVPEIGADGSIHYKQCNKDAQGEYKTKDSEYVPIITWITAYGRLTLLDMMDEAGNDWSQGTQYITGDTDSGFIASEEPFIPSLGITDTEINTFGYEHKPEEIGMFCATRQKTYIMVLKGGKTALKVAGMTDDQKNLFLTKNPNPILSFSKESIKVEGGKLIKKTTEAGAILVDTNFEFKPTKAKKADPEKILEKVDLFNSREPKNQPEAIEKAKWDISYQSKIRDIIITSCSKAEVEERLGFKIDYGFIGRYR